MVQSIVPARVRTLLSAFGGADAELAASEEALTAVAGTSVAARLSRWRAEAH